ncbi:MAG: cytidine deaminase [Clostridia bacterium]|jgi:cytidine deaminase|nr:cytidine deaminase [Clostridia bacterium]
MNALTQQEIDRLLDLAEEARDHSYAPYSKYHVGAALLTADGQVYQGCNIENAAFTPTNCAERTAFFKAVYDGHRAFKAIAIIATGEEMGFPCGVCRQVMAEFCDRDFIIITANKDRSKVDVSPFETLLPHSFGPKDLDV